MAAWQKLKVFLVLYHNLKCNEIFITKTVYRGKKTPLVVYVHTFNHRKKKFKHAEKVLST